MRISVIIPTLNESETIADVIAVVRAGSNRSSNTPPWQKLISRVVPRVVRGSGPAIVDEIIVVDDHSADDTVEKARNAGAQVIISAKRGKGASMREGLLVAKGDIVVYLDGDIANYDPHVVEHLTRPILDGRYDFVKATFDRQAGRVTELVAKPLLGLLFPEAQHFSQPLSGMIAGRRDLLLKAEFEQDYGVDIGILLDMLKEGARIKEVSIGSVENKMKQWRQLSPMSYDVARAILKRVQRRPNYTLEGMTSSNIVLDQLEIAFRESVGHLEKMAILDLDNTTFVGRFIEEAAREHGFENELTEIISSETEGFVITKQIAKLLKGLNYAQLLSIADKIPLVRDAKEVISELKKRGYVVGIVSDGYEFIAQHIGNKLSADFAIANELEFSNGVATGEVKIPSFLMRTKDSLCKHNFCKSNVMLHLSEKYGIPRANILAIGDSDPDICMVKHAGIGVAFCSDSGILNRVADKVIDQKTFKPLLEFAH